MISSEILQQLNTTEEQLIRHLDNDVREIFVTMVGTEISSSETTVSMSKFTDSVSAMVGFAGNYNGMISLNAPQSLAIVFASQMLGMEIPECNDDVTDALGELANMIGGSFKHHFVKNGQEVQLSTPSVISGDEYLMTVNSQNTIALAFESCSQHFLVCVYLELSD